MRLGDNNHIEFHRRRSGEEYDAAYRATSSAARLKHLALALDHSIRAFECRHAANIMPDNEEIAATHSAVVRAFKALDHPSLKFGCDPQSN